MTLNISQITPRISSKKLAMIAAVNILRDWCKTGGVSARVS
jgi:hypothetical protein